MGDTAENKIMEETLLIKEIRDRDDSLSNLTWQVFSQEVKKLGYIAGPMVAVTLSQYLLQFVSIMMLGMASALETLSGQAYGAKQYQKLGIQTQTAIFCLILVCIPLSVIWINVGNILIFIGQDPKISHEAGKFITSLIPALFAYATLQPLVRYFQAQSLIFPMVLSSCGTLCLHIPLCWALVFKSGLENLGAALAMCISNWTNVIFLGLYMKYSSACAKTRAPISMQLLHGIGEFFRFAIPSAVMICLEWWSFELLVLLSGLLPNPELETSVLSVCLTIISTLYGIPYGFGAAARVSNELGAGNPQAARIAVYAVLFLVIVETTVFSATLFASRRVFGYVFSNEKEVVDYVTTMAPLVCLSCKGSGWQHIGAYINLGAFYLCGIPVAAILGFWVKLRGRGLWIGIQVGAFTQTVLLAIVTSCTDWKRQASKAKERLFEGRSLVDNAIM
ncbi:hypothetical protein GH714_018094 [Hevea brasiliensis]|uniref:Protein DETOXIFICATION n=1 Tax=Hevea brasiliensis TaxID=3981 RepID=A0A6A6MAX8_HEVBR|nr:hypothetical protein GH714_017960 [Hevea brasiliensis]KAF2310878.1 hypothetical protein GH714_018094 [Hevea brasiliensis]